MCAFALIPRKRPSGSAARRSAHSPAINFDVLLDIRQSVIVRYRLEVSAGVEAEDYADALRRVGEHFLAWSRDTPSDDPDTWTTEHSLQAPHLDGRVTLTPVDAEGKPIA